MQHTYFKLGRHKLGSFLTAVNQPRRSFESLGLGFGRPVWQFCPGSSVLVGLPSFLMFSAHPTTRLCTGPAVHALCLSYCLVESCSGRSDRFWALQRQTLWLSHVLDTCHTLGRRRQMLILLQLQG